MPNTLHELWNTGWSRCSLTWLHWSIILCLVLGFPESQHRLSHWNSQSLLSGKSLKHLRYELMQWVINLVLCCSKSALHVMWNKIVQIQYVLNFILRMSFPWLSGHLQCMNTFASLHCRDYCIPDTNLEVTWVNKREFILILISCTSLVFSSSLSFISAELLLPGIVWRPSVCPFVCLSVRPFVRLLTWAQM